WSSHRSSTACGRTSSPPRTPSDPRAGRWRSGCCSPSTPRCGWCCSRSSDSRPRRSPPSCPPASSTYDCGVGSPSSSSTSRGSPCRRPRPVLRCRPTPRTRRTTAPWCGSACASPSRSRPGPRSWPPGAATRSTPGSSPSCGRRPPSARSTSTSTCRASRSGTHRAASGAACAAGS
ncbi:MAG: hypothetical protein AVDCRST_MAG24-297, partial [uncultured Nocardioidaceae bacterium]